MRAARRLEASPEGGLRARQGFDDPGGRKFPAFRTLEVEQVAVADSGGQRGGGIAPESGFKIAVSHACNGEAAGMAVQTINSHAKDKKNS
jgi:predicted RNA-binding protein with TRAM domain